MSNRRWIATIAVSSLLVVSLAGAALVPATLAGQAVVKTTVTVIAGQPTELAFTLSRSSDLPWSASRAAVPIAFEVTNRGTLPHDFKICVLPVKQATADVCRGESTRSLRPGQSATLLVSFRQRGDYEYLSSRPADAAGGMKGLIGVGVRLAKPPAVTTTARSTTTTSTVPSSLVGNANAGQLVYASAGCGSCHTLTTTSAPGTTNLGLGQIRPTQAVIVQFVTNGTSTASGSMPAYAGTLTPTQINDLAAYVYFTTHIIN